MSRLCINCGAPVAAKPAYQPGPQPKYCGRGCQTVAARRAWRDRNQRNALAAAAFADIDWARVPASAVEDFVARYSHAVDGGVHKP